MPKIQLFAFLAKNSPFSTRDRERGFGLYGPRSGRSKMFSTNF